MLFHDSPHRAAAGPPFPRTGAPDADGSADPVRPAEASGFPSPARDYYHGGIDLNRHLIRDRTSTFIMRVAGNSMAASGIADGDELIVDRSLVPRDGSVVVAVLDGELAVRRLGVGPRGVLLATDDGAAPTEVGELADLTVWGVVTRCLHHV